MVSERLRIELRRVAPAGLALDPYEVIAPFYDLGMEDHQEDVDLCRGLAERTGGAVLELGCGTGRLALPLARAGFRVVGLDRSAAMLRLARAKLAQEPDLAVQLLQATMCRPPLNARFGLILVASDSFLHLGGAEEQIACLRAVRALLGSQGLLMLDLSAPGAPGWDDWSAGVRPLVLAWSVSLEDGTRVNKYSSFSADASTQTHAVTDIYEQLAIDGLLRRWTVEYTLRFVFPAELELLLEASHLRLLGRYGDYDLGPFQSESERQLCVVGPAPARRRR